MLSQILKQLQLIFKFSFKRLQLFICRILGLKRRNMVSVPYLPELVMHNIFLHLPTKSAIRISSVSKEWMGVWSELPVLDFVEGNQRHGNENRFKIKHANFIRILARYLELRKKDKQQWPLEKLRLHMRYTSGDEEDALIDMMLSTSFQRNVKELDISLRGEYEEVSYCLSGHSLLSGNCLTKLSLAFLIMEENIACVFPSLKTVSLKKVHFRGMALSNLILGCPAADSLALASCSFGEDKISLSGCSLKSVEIKNCEVVCVRINQNLNLETFSLDSNCSSLWYLCVTNSFNLSSVKVHAQHLELCSLSGCHDKLKATINTPSLNLFEFEGHIKSQVNLSAPTSMLTFIKLNDQQFPSFNGPWKHFATLRDFLEQFGCSDKVILSLGNYEAIIFPDNFKRAFNPPLRNTQHIVLEWYPTDDTETNLEASVRWMAPSLKTFVIRMPGM